MAIDITNHHIGIALAYYRQQLSPPSSAHPSYENHESIHSDNDDMMCNSPALIATSITPLPPIPYMSDRAYHPSYAFLHHHPPEGARHNNMPRCLDRLERTIEVADQLAQLAISRQVKGIVVRWPGELACAVGDGDLSGTGSTREAEEGKLLFSSTTASTRNIGRGAGLKIITDGSMGYMRGRILYLLDKCCTRHGHGHTNVHMEPLLMEGSRPFTLFDTSVSEMNWIIREQPRTDSRNSRQNDMQQTYNKGRDKYGNSVMEMDLWGRCPTFGNHPPQPQQGKYYYSSMETNSGYSVSRQFILGINDGIESGAKPSSHRRHNGNNFDGLPTENESRGKQFHESLAAMHTLCGFVKEHLPKSRIVLPVWASTTYAATPSNTTIPTALELQNERGWMHGSDSEIESLPDDISSHLSKSSSKTKVPDLQIKQPKAAISLAQLPIRKATHRSKR